MASGQKISISYDEATALANTMCTEAEEMEAALNAAGNEISTCIESSWGGTSGVSVGEKIADLKTTFSTFRTAVENYATFVRESVRKWKEVDEKTATAAANLTQGFNGGSTSRVTHTGLQE